MFSIEVRPREKIFFFLISGFFTLQDAMDFSAAFKRKLQSIDDPTQYTLIADGSALQVSTQEMLPLLKRCIIMCQRTPFKKRYLVGMESHLALGQMQRLIKEVDLEIEIVTSMNEVKY